MITLRADRPLPLLDDWVDGHRRLGLRRRVEKRDAVTVEWCDTLVDGNGNEHRASKFADWGFHWKHGAIHIGQTQIAESSPARSPLCL